MSVREVRVIVNGPEPTDHGGEAHVYIRDDSGWYHLVVAPFEEIGDVRRFVDGIYLSWPKEAPP